MRAAPALYRSYRLPFRGHFPFFNQLYDIANIPKSVREPRGHGRRHANAAVDPREAIPRRIECDHVDMVLDLLGMSVGQAGEAAQVLVGRRNQRLDWLNWSKVRSD